MYQQQRHLLCISPFYLFRLPCCLSWAYASTAAYQDDSEKEEQEIALLGIALDGKS